ncbi:hypothetical protein E2P81_ATG06455 [Venturia nashicola]|uniref:Fungal lipase-type domain-containing protein n=1 Tax=Venturia nashicola TaxID=86259 RepID=A0A4Z1P376_9PEZI|nr:hypothetical protein E6O75_ATG06616 [Venturia nashicola]TLD28109.1 hypothetical protein E2P81_ATG06455 [Venturia nashicola]
MPLVRMKPQDNGEQWSIIAMAGHVLWKASAILDLKDLSHHLTQYFNDSTLHITKLETGINDSHKAVILSRDSEITIAFLGSSGSEIHMNTWHLAKNPGIFSIPFERRDGGNLVHSFYFDMWKGMEAAAKQAISDAVARLKERGKKPEKIIVCGFSMGGGVSSLAFTDILNHVRNTFGSGSANRESWAEDRNLSSLIQHITFAEYPAADMGYHTILNHTYGNYQIPAWDFVNHRDQTSWLHIPHFKSWRGHRYILPAAVVDPVAPTFGKQCHNIEGYAKAA